MRFLRYILALLCGALSLSPAGAQTIEHYSFSNLSLDDGLSQITATCIHQDSRGYMWFGTRNGLNRYDGYRFESFMADHDDPATISDSHILAIAEDGDGYLWIATNNGLNRMSPHDGRFRRYMSDPLDATTIPGPVIQSLLVDSSGRLWAGTNNGLCRYDAASDSFERIDALAEPLSANPVCVIAEGDDGRLYLGTTSGGVVIYDPRGGGHEVLRHDPADPKSIAHDFVRSILLDSNGNLWIGTHGGGVSVRWESSPDFETFDVRDGLSNNKVRQLVESPQGYIVVATYDGMNVIEPSTGEIDRYVAYNRNSGDLSHYSIYSLYFDRAHTLWVGTYAGGVDYHNPYARRFEFNDLGQAENGLLGIIGAMVETEDYIYIAIEGSGIVEMDKRDRSIRNYMIHNADRRTYMDNIVKSLCVDGDRLLCGTNTGTIWAFDLNTRCFSLVYDMKVSDPIYHIGRDSRGNLLVGSVNDRKGLVLISPERRVTESFPTAGGGSRTFGNVRCVLELTPGRFLIGTRNDGLYDFDMNDGKLVRYTADGIDGDTGAGAQHPLPDNYVISIFRDSRGDIWIGTFGGGLSRFQPGEGVVATFGRKNGLSSDNICTIIEGRSGTLWISTISGISEFNPATGTATAYTHSNGIRVGEFSPHSGLRSADGTIIFGGNNGITMLHPESMHPNPFVPPVVLRNLYIDNRRITPGDGTGVLDQTPGRQDGIVLRHDQTNISIEYSALNYIFPERNQYRYRLEGFDAAWNDVGERRMAYYTNIPAGKYRFVVTGSNNDGVWNETPVGIDITVLPPLWQTWWAYAIYSLVFAIVLWLVSRWFGEKRRLENDIKLRQAEAKAREELHVERTRLFTNFSHELRTPLTLIISPLSNIVETETAISPKTRSNLLLMRDNADRLLRLVNNLMDFQKNESGKLALRVSDGNFVDFARQTIGAFSQFAAQRRVELSFVHSDDDIPYRFDRRLMEKVFFNYLSNALKNVPDGGRVEVRVSRLSLAALRAQVPGRSESFTDEGIGYILMDIADSGAGILADDLEKIFIPFYQVAQNEHSASGTGLGLSLSRSIIEMHHGVIWAESPEGGGAVFRTILPVDATLFEDCDTEEAQCRRDIVEPRPVPVAATQTDGAEETAADSGKKRYSLLVVEDNTEVRRFIVSSLRDRYTVHEASNGADALDKAFYHMPDLVISDIMMPRLSGLEMTARLKNDLRTSHIPVILITAKTMPDDIREGYHNGADDYIVKPFDCSVLVARVENLILSREKLKAIYGKRFSLESLGIDTVSSDERFMTKFYEIMDRNLSNPEFNLDVLSREIGMSRAQMYRKVKAVTNLSPNEFIRNFRLELGAKMLKETDMSVSDVFVAVGFSSLAYFSNCFKNLYGVTPTEYSSGERRGG